VDDVTFVHKSGGNSSRSCTFSDLPGATSGAKCDAGCLVIIIRPHRSTTYVNAAYCYRPSSMVCPSVGLPLTVVIPVKTAEPIEMPFWLRNRVGPRNHVLDGVEGPDPWEAAMLRGKGHPIVKYRDTVH